MNDDDEQFLRDMIEHHTAALAMARGYLDSTQPKTRQARVAALARDIITMQTAEIAKMRGWLPTQRGTARSPMVM